jgi:hypothetical protein
VLEIIKSHEFSSRELLLLLNFQSFDWLAAVHLELLQAILFIAVLQSALVFLATFFKYCSRDRSIKTESVFFPKPQ